MLSIASGMLVCRMLAQLSGTWHVAGVFNLGNRKKKVTLDLNRDLGLPPKDYAAFEFWRRSFTEVKKGRPASSDLTRQLRRYLASDELDAVIVVTQRGIALPGTLCGKPVHLISLNRLWGVALP